MIAARLTAPGSLRVPSLKNFSCASMYRARCPARLGTVSLTLVPEGPWHAAHTVAANCFPASTSAACADCVAAKITINGINAFIGFSWPSSTKYKPPAHAIRTCASLEPGRHRERLGRVDDEHYERCQFCRATVENFHCRPGRMSVH